MADRTDCRTTEVLRRVKKRRRLHENHLLAGLSSICITLICCLFCTIVSLINNMPQSNIIIDTYGAVLLYSSADTYVLVALLSFVAGVVITALCIRTQNKNKCFKTNKNDEEKTKWKKDS